jgi:ABC-2 type transport system permease protein
VWKQINVQLRMRTLSMFSFGLVVTQPAIFSAVGYFLARAAGRTQIDFVHTIIGSGVMGLWSTLLFTSFFDLRADRREGTLELLVGSPTSLFSILAIRCFANVMLGSVSYALPLTRGIQAARLAMAGAAWPEVYLLFLGELLVGSAYIALGFLMFTRFEKLSLVDGQIEAM